MRINSVFSQFVKIFIATACLINVGISVGATSTTCPNFQGYLQAVKASGQTLMGIQYEGNIWAISDPGAPVPTTGIWEKTEASLGGITGAVNLDCISNVSGKNGFWTIFTTTINAPQQNCTLNGVKLEPSASSVGNATLTCN